MILPEFSLSKKNVTEYYCGVDSLEQCLDKEHFLSYPHTIGYEYTSRGFRDREWPDTIEELKKCIWCFGDSFTVGIGSPFEHVWPQVLEKTANIRTINVSMNGASNDWIFRKAMTVIDEIKPKNIVIQWSYVERYEMDSGSELNQRWKNYYNSIKDESWPVCPELIAYNSLPEKIRSECETMHIIDEKFDWRVDIPEEDRTVHCSYQDTKEDVSRLLAYIEELPPSVIHSFIPRFVDNSYISEIYSFMDFIEASYIPEITVLDWARDHHHYGGATALNFVSAVVRELSI